MVVQGGKAVIISLPNALSLFRIIVTPFFLYFSFHGESLVAMALFFAAVLSDWADGFFARLLKRESVLGEVLDPIADKILLMASFIGFFLMGKIPFWIMIVAVGRDVLLLVSGLFILLKKYDFRMKPARLSKWNTALQMLYIAVVAFQIKPEWSVFLGCLASLTTLLSALLYIHVFKTWYTHQDTTV